MDNNQTPEQRIRLIFMSIGTLNALLGVAIMSIYFGLFPINIAYMDFPNWVIGILGVTWFFSGVGVVAFTAMHMKK